MGADVCRMENIENPGLVIYAKTGRETVEEKLVALADCADSKSRSPGANYSVVFSPGSVRLKREGLASHVAPANFVARKPITAWSRKSRANMVARFATLDYTPMTAGSKGLAVMVTLTYPSQWLVVAPNGRAAKRHLQLFRKRFERAYKRPILGLWKTEFQRRGAVHFHIFCAAPSGLSEFRRWVASTWSEIVAHPDPEERQKHLNAGTAVDLAKGALMSDARLIAIYFSKHGSPGSSSKEYQNAVPEEWQKTGSVGRFWGYWGLRPLEVSANLSEQELIQAARILRRWFRAKGLRKVCMVQRVNSSGVVRTRKTTRRQQRLSGSRGFLVVEDGVLLAQCVVRFLEHLRLNGGIDVEENAKASLVEDNL